MFRSLQNKWDQVRDHLSDEQRKTELSLVQLSTFEDSVGQFESWLKDIGVKVAQSTELQANLSAKNIQLQNLRVGDLKATVPYSFLLSFAELPMLLILS